MFDQVEYSFNLKNKASKITRGKSISNLNFLYSKIHFNSILLTSQDIPSMTTRQFTTKLIHEV